MKLYKKGLPLLLCLASTVLCGCSSKNSVCTHVGVYSVDAFVQAELDLVQKDVVEIDVYFGVAAIDTKTTWDDIVYEYHIDYFKLKAYTSAYCYLDKSYQQAVDTLGSNVYISKEYIVDVSSSSSTKVEEKNFRNKYVNDGKTIKMFYVKQTISLLAKQYSYNGDGAKFYLACGAFTNENKLADKYQRELKDGLYMDYTYEESVVKFEILAPFTSFSPVKI